MCLVQWIQNATVQQFFFFLVSVFFLTIPSICYLVVQGCGFELVSSCLGPTNVCGNLGFIMAQRTCILLYFLLIIIIHQFTSCICKIASACIVPLCHTLYFLLELFLIQYCFTFQIGSSMGNIFIFYYTDICSIHPR